MFLHQCNVDVEKLRISLDPGMTVGPHVLLSCLFLLLCPTQLNLDQSVRT